MAETGGFQATGGSISTGGKAHVGGAIATGGKATGGFSTTGGRATGGVFATGGRATGGVFATGGRVTGGFPATGGRATGGLFATGGIQATGGRTWTGGIATGGALGSGGVASGGTSSTGSTAGSGGVATGGASPVGGTATGTGGIATSIAGQSAGGVSAVTTTAEGGTAQWVECVNHRWTWLLRNTKSEPGYHISPNLTYDPHRRETVLLTPSADLWSWNGTRWQLLPAVTRPPTRDFAEIAADSARGVIVMFGGARSGYPNDTWEYTDDGWMQTTPPHTPWPRAGHRMVFDERRAVIVMHGGYDGDYMSDTWEYDGNDWYQPPLSGDAPGAQSVSGLTFDSRRGVTIEAAGYNSHVDGSVSGTWEYDGSWREVAGLSDSPRCTASSCVDLAYHHSADLTVGVVTGGSATIWLWDGSFWHTCPVEGGLSPVLEIDSKVSYDPERGVVVAYSSRNETWELIRETR